jgi:hypothetical protein
MKAQHAFLEKAERVPLDGPYAGQSFNDPTLEAFKARLLLLRDAGYHFPDYVIERIDAEIAERDAAP